MMEPELKQQLRVEDPMEEPELNLDGLQISSIRVLLEPPASLDADADEDDEEGFYSPLDHFQNLVKLSMSSSQCESLEGFPHLPLLRSLLLADNNLSSGFEALAEAELHNLVRLDLSGNKIVDVSVLRPLDALESLQHLSLAENEIATQDNYRGAVFDVLPQLITVDGLDRDGTELLIDDDEALVSGDEEEDIESQSSESEIEDQENRPVMGGKTTGGSSQVDDEENYDELDDEDDEVTQHQYQRASDDEEDDEVAQQQYQRVSDDEEDDEEEDDEEEEEEEEEEDDHDEEDEEDEEGESPGLAYLLTENIQDIQDENDKEFEPGNEDDEESEIDSSDDEEYGSRNAASAPAASTSSSSNTNGHHHHKRPRSPTLASEFDHGSVGNASGFGFDADADTTNGFGMALFDGPATFDDEAAHDNKRQRS